MKKLSDAQVAALATVSSWNIEVGFESMSGTTRRTMQILEERGLVEIVGARKTYWKLTRAGKAEVRRLIDEGEIVIEPEEQPANSAAGRLTNGAGTSD